MVSPAGLFYGDERPVDSQNTVESPLGIHLVWESSIVKDPICKYRDEAIPDFVLTRFGKPRSASEPPFTMRKEGAEGKDGSRRRGFR